MASETTMTEWEKQATDKANSLENTFKNIRKIGHIQGEFFTTEEITALINEKDLRKRKNLVDNLYLLARDAYALQTLTNKIINEIENRDLREYNKKIADNKVEIECKKKNLEEVAATEETIKWKRFWRKLARWGLSVTFIIFAYSIIASVQKHTDWGEDYIHIPLIDLFKSPIGE